MQTYCGHLHATQVERREPLAINSTPIEDLSIEVTERQNLQTSARAEKIRFLVRPFIGLLVSSFLYAYVSHASAAIWLSTLLGVEAVGFWLRRQFLAGNFKYQPLIYVNSLAASLVWVTHAVLLWRCDGMVPHIAAVMNLLSVSYYAAIGSYYSRRVFLAMALPQLATLSWLLITYLVANAPPLVAAAASLATVGACGTILLNSFLMYASDQKLRRSNSDLARTAESARLANEAKSNFLATMSHEIRTPLNGILGMAQALSTEDLLPHQRSRLTVIEKSGNTLLAVLNDILDVAKIEAGMLTLEIVEFDLSDLLASAIAPFERLASARGVEMSLQISEDAAGPYFGDPTRLHQVLYNLVSNAIKFSEAGQIRVMAARQDRMLQITVADTGSGIPPDRLELMFQPFTQADSSTTRRFGGTGLGLAICSQLAALMDGEIKVTSTLGEGSEFTLTIPAIQAADVKGTTPPKEPSALDVSNTHHAPAEARRPLRILAADDNEINRLVLKTLLGQFGVEPVLVETGAAAVQAFCPAGWDVILMDIQMPVMDGVQAAKKIRALEAAAGSPRTPIIALTANALAHQVEEYRTLGFDAHVAKPIEVGALLTAIDGVLLGPDSTEEAQVSTTRT